MEQPRALPKLQIILDDTNWDDWSGEFRSHMFTYHMAHVVATQAEKDDAERVVRAAQTGTPPQATPASQPAQSQVSTASTSTSSAQVSTAQPVAQTAIDLTPCSNDSLEIAKAKLLLSPTTPAQDSWVRLAIKNNVRAHIQKGLAQIPSAALIWLQLEKSYKSAEQETAATLLQRVMSFTQGPTDTVAVTNMRMQTLRDQILSMGLSLEQIVDHLCVEFYIRGVRPQYASTVDNLRVYHRGTLTLNDLTMATLNAEHRFALQQREHSVAHGHSVSHVVPEAAVGSVARRHLRGRGRGVSYSQQPVAQHMPFNSRPTGMQQAQHDPAAQRRKENVCRKCGKKGHWLEECWHGQYMDSRNRGQQQTRPPMRPQVRPQFRQQVRTHPQARAHAVHDLQRDAPAGPSCTAAIAPMSNFEM